MSNKLSHYIFLLFPLSFVLPPLVSVGEIRLNWYELLLLPILLTGWRREANYIIVLLVGLCFATAISNYFAPNLVDITPNFKNYSLFKYMVSYIAALQLGLRISKADLEKTNPIALLSFIFLIFLVIAAVYSDDLRTRISGIYGVEKLPTVRIQLIDSNPLILGSITLILWFLVSQGKTFAIRFILLILALIPVFFAQQRASLILISLIFIIINSSFSTKIITPILIILISFIIGVAISRSDFLSEYTYRFSVNEYCRGSNLRLDSFRIAWHQFLDYPLLGVGRCVEMRKVNWHGIIRVEPHSQYFGIIHEIGLIGMVPFVLLFRYVFKISIILKKMKTCKFRKSLLAMVAAYFVSMLAWETLYLPHYSIFFFFVIGVIISETKIDSECRKVPANSAKIR